MTMPTKKLSNCLSLLVVVTALAMTGVAIASPEVPGAPQAAPIALVGGTVHTMTGPTLDNATVLFERGKITVVGRELPIPAGAVRVDVTGRHVYPGLIDAMTTLGLVEIPSVRGSVDDAETGDINPNVCSWQAINPDSELIPVTRANGVLVTHTSPVGALITGRSALIQLDGWTNEQMTVRKDVAVHAHWPRMAPIHTWRLEETTADQLSNRDKTLKRLRQTMLDARAYWLAKQAATDGKAPQPAHDERWEALIPVLERKQPVMIHADEIQQIQSAVAWAAEFNLRVILCGGYDAPRCVDLLKKHDIPVVVTGVHRLPQRRDDPYDTPFTVPAQLHQAGVKYCIAGLGRMGNVRNLPYHAATAVAFGLPRDEAERALTLYAAQILGAADRLGSLEAGKDATLFVATGDTLEIDTHVTSAYIQGRQVDLSDRQQKLWKKYQEKYRQLDAAKKD
ncbi:MAG: amidohydrolase family protein [Planctomycetes bacterium]|nr:amidohydrolase family protein [Planctomycetota bacterium]